MVSELEERVGALEERLRQLEADNAELRSLLQSVGSLLASSGDQASKNTAAEGMGRAVAILTAAVSAEEPISEDPLFSETVRSHAAEDATGLFAGMTNVAFWLLNRFEEATGRGVQETLQEIAQETAERDL